MLVSETYIFRDGTVQTLHETIPLEDFDILLDVARLGCG